jgi:predicted DCC family thiol-disulfide oxidoreductase YuxK
MKNGWTGGQYSLFRITLGLSIALYFAALVPAGAPPVVSKGLLAFASVASLVLALGFHDRAAAVLLFCAWAWPFGRSSPIHDPDAACVGFLLLAHACLPPAPYGSLAARGRSDPGGGWRFPPRVFALAWILMAAGYGYSGITKLLTPGALVGLGAWLTPLIEIPAASLALVRGARPWIWLALVVLHLSRSLLGVADPSLGMVMLHFFTFDPGWVRGKGEGIERLFYDGSCALCHGAVRFVLAEDPEGRVLRFAPLDSEVFRATVPAEARNRIPDSVVVATREGRLLTRSAGVLHVLERLGGIWRLLAAAGRLVPAPLRDAAYDLVAGTRYRVFGRKDEACPMIPTALRGRFDL